MNEQTERALGDNSRDFYSLFTGFFAEFGWYVVFAVIALYMLKPKYEDWSRSRRARAAKHPDRVRTLDEERRAARERQQLAYEEEKRQKAAEAAKRAAEKGTEETKSGDGSGSGSGSGGGSGARRRNKPLPLRGGPNVTAGPLSGSSSFGSRARFGSGMRSVPRRGG